jgi:hypothetical protein
VLIYWLQNHFHDFDEDRNLARKFFKFARSKRRAAGDGKLLEIVFTTQLERHRKMDTSDSMLAKPVANFSEPNIHQLDTSVLAAQLTLIEHKLFRAIRFQEFLGQVRTITHSSFTFTQYFNLTFNFI